MSPIFVTSLLCTWKIRGQEVTSRWKAMKWHYESGSYKFANNRQFGPALKNRIVQKKHPPSRKKSVAT